MKINEKTLLNDQQMHENEAYLYVFLICIFEYILIFIF